MLRVIASCLLALVILITTSAFAQEGLTRLRASTPKGVFRTRTSTYLESVSVEVRNVGSHAAENVEVYATLPTGRSIRLTGPSSIGRNEEVVYSRTVWELVTNENKIKISKLSCDNCRD